MNFGRRWEVWDKIKLMNGGIILSITVYTLAYFVKELYILAASNMKYVSIPVYSTIELQRMYPPSNSDFAVYTHFLIAKTKGANICTADVCIIYNIRKLAHYHTLHIWLWVILYSSIVHTAVDHLVVEYSTVQYSTVQHSTAQYSTVQHSTVQYSTTQYSTTQYSTTQYSTVQHSTVQYSTVQYSTVQ